MIITILVKRRILKMRKHDVRKWIHAICDLLPLLVIPVFALGVRSDNGVNPIEVQQEKYEVVNFNQYVENGSTVTNFSNNGNYDLTSYNLNSNSKYLINFYSLDVLNNTNIRFGAIDSNYSWVFLDNSIVNDTAIGLKQYIYTSNEDTNYLRICLFNQTGSNINIKNVEFFNLTQMFGIGNEPSIVEFNSYFPNDYYDYTLSDVVLINVGFVNFNDTDVGSQMVYTLYNTVDKYFNFDKVFNFNKIYEWLEINVFNGTVPLGAYIVWNVFLYEFLMDLMFLLYALFMFFIDMCTNLIDRFTCQASGGRLK